MGQPQVKLTPKEQAKMHRRTVDKASRTIERERTKLQQNEKKLMTEIKKMAKEGQHKAAKILAKDLVRTRNQVSNYFTMNSQLKALSMKLSTISTQATLSEALRGVSSAMKGVNEQMDVKAIAGIMKEFTKENAKLGMNQEMMGDAIDMGMDDGNEEEEADGIYGQILEEVGIEYVAEANIGGVMRAPKVKEEAKEEGGNDISDLEARLNQLKQ